MKWIVDRFEEYYAVVECGGKCFNIPANFLPDNAKEGSVLDISVNIAETENRKTQLQSRLKKLFGD